MRFGRLLSGSVLLLTLPGLAYTHSHRAPTAPRTFSHRTSHAVVKATGQRSIDDTRATQIQTALTSAGYLSGEPTGRWDSATEAAMQRFQAANGWQTKLIPDSRAIIKLGLGPGSSAGSIADAPAASSSDIALR